MNTKNSNKLNVETIEKRESFLFYRSFFEAIETLSIKNRLIAYEAIVKYGLTKEEAIDLPRGVLAILKMAMPIIKAAQGNYDRRAKSTSQKSQNNTSDDFDKDCAEEVLLPEKEYKNNSTENSLTQEEFESNLKECLSILEQD